MWHFMIKDFSEPISYIPMGCWIALLYAMLRILYLALIQPNHDNVKLDWRHLLMETIFVVYTVVVIILTFLSREPGSREGVSLALGETWGSTWREHLFVIENVILLVPYGMLFPCLWKQAQKWQVTIGSGVLLSILLETSQYITKRGYCQLDDVVTNGLGCVVGYGVWWIGAKLLHSLLGTCQKRRRVLGTVVVLWMIVVFAFSSRNGDLSTEDSYRVGRLAGSLFATDFNTWTPERQEAFAASVDYPIRKVAHATEYAMLGFLLAALCYDPKKTRRYRLLLPYAIGTLYAMTDEFHQRFVPGRSGQLTDVLIDSTGVLFGVLLLLLLIPKDGPSFHT